jgi:hypothetical protein
VDISTRAGYDSDCNPSNAAGILGTMLGYSNIPDYWKQGLDRVEDRNFVYTDMSLLDVYDTGYGHALQMIERNGGRVLDDAVEIRYQKVEPVRFEESFSGIFPLERRNPRRSLNLDNPEFTTGFTGSGVVVGGNAVRSGSGLPDRDLTLDVYINGEFLETVIMPTQSRTRKHEVYWNYELPEAAHDLRLVVRDIPRGYQVNLNSLIIYSGNDPGPQSYF